MTINLNGKLMDLSTPKVMGILNITPDSFYDGGVFSSEKKHPKTKQIRIKNRSKTEPGK